MLKQAAFFLAFIVLLLTVFVLSERAFSPTFQQCAAEYQNADTNPAAKENPSRFSAAVSTYVRCSAEFFDDHEGGITALATLIIAAFTGTLWYATSQGAKLTKEALIADKKAFVFASGVYPEFEIGANPGMYSWRFRPIWQNTGDTPTKHMTIHTACELRNTQLPSGFNFGYATTRTHNHLLGPKSSNFGGVSPQFPDAAITPQDLHDVRMQTKFLYLWGWVRYNDIFPDTPEHITRFCWLIIPLGDPFTFQPNAIGNPPAQGALTFNTILHAEGNCADDECT